MNSSFSARLVTLFVSLSLVAVTVHGQDRDLFNARNVLRTAAPVYDTLVLNNSTSLRLGWNWGLPVSRLSDALKARTLHYAYESAFYQTSGLMTPSGSRFLLSTTAGSDTTDTVFVVPHIRINGINQYVYGLEEYKCLRFDPEISVQKEGFTKDTAASPGATFGFMNRHDSLGSAGRRVLMNDARFPIDDTILVLSKVWPDSAMFARYSSHGIDSAFDGQGFRSGRKLLVSVNLRRANGSVNVKDSIPVLILKLKYTLFDSTTGYVSFSQKPNPSSLLRLNSIDSTIGFKYAEVGGGGVSTEFVVRRNLLRSYPQSINLSALAEFQVGDYDSTKDNQILQELFAANNGPHAIRKLDLEVYYVTHTDTAENLDLELDYVKLETPRARDFLSGKDSATFVNSHVAFLNDLRRIQGNARTFRIAAWYAHDEAEMMYWEGWRQYNNLFDSNSISEVGLDYAEHLLHKTGVKRLWQGYTPKFSRKTALPYYNYSIADKQAGYTDSDYLGFEHGLLHSMSDPGYLHSPSGLSSINVDYETWWGTKHIDSTHFSVELPMPSDRYNEVVCDSTQLQAVAWASTQSAIEGVYYRYYVRPEFLFLGADTPWYANIWPNSEWSKDTSSNLTCGISRPPTGSETYAMAYGQLILGAKGLLAYYAVSSDETTNATYPVATQNVVAVGATSLFSNESSPTATGWGIVRSSGLRGDYFNVNPALEPTRVTGYMTHAGSPTTADPGHFANALGVDTARLYAGRESMRIALYRVYNYANAIADTLQDLELQGWWAKGYKQWTKETPGFALGDYIQFDSLKVGHPSRVDSNGVLHGEPYDSIFADITIHKKRGVSLDSNFYVGIANRRTDPRVYTGGDWRFFTEAQFEDSLLATAPNGFRNFDQRGSREYRIPFHYTHPSGNDYLLHVEELRAKGSPGIDTVIRSNAQLAVRLRPGNGVFLKVTPIPSFEISGKGFLDHSNQRKLVAFPKYRSMESVQDTVDLRTYSKMIIGDTMWYHQVYHVRRNVADSNQAGALSVFYRRSKPMRVTHDSTSQTQYVFGSPAIEWDTTINVSDKVTFDSAGTEYPTVLDLSCGYPALVVRVDTLGPTDVSKVYIVFGCEYVPHVDTVKVLICETVIPAEVPSYQQRAYYTSNPSRVLDSTSAPIQPILEHWGTPMINASQSGNFYCWTHADRGIGVGFKTPWARQFTGAQKTYIRARAELNFASHPSMNTYSRLNLGEEDASLVWQEGVAPNEGNFIFYTRLIHGAAPVYAINSQLNNSAYRTEIGTGFVDAYNPNIGMIEDAYDYVQDGMEFNAQHAFPVVYRHLSDWETTTINSRHYLRLVNHKADRIYWQSRRTHLYTGNWMVARRMIDISEYSLSPLGGNDILYSKPTCFVYNLEENLRGPDVAQGEQWGEPGSVPYNPLANYEDSCSVVNFWSDTSDSDMTPEIWHMLFGFSFYGSDTSHTQADIIDAGLLEHVHGFGRYPHLAARYSVSSNRGYRRSRRVFDEPGGTWTNYSDAPFMCSSSEYFYKVGDNSSDPLGLLYSGYRGNGISGSVGPIFLHSTQEWISLNAVQDSSQLNSLFESEPAGFVSDWYTFPSATDVTITTSVSGDRSACQLFVERESDGREYDLELLSTDQTHGMSSRMFTFLGGDQGRYRFVIRQSDEGVQPVRDVEIITPETGELAKHAFDARYAGIIDLKAMAGVHPTAAELWVFPNPTRERVSIAIDLDQEKSKSTSTSRRKVDVYILNQIGVEVLRLQCSETDLLHVDVDQLPQGVYNVLVCSTANRMKHLSTSFVLLR